MATDILPREQGLRKGGKKMSKSKWQRREFAVEAKNELTSFLNALNGEGIPPEHIKIAPTFKFWKHHVTGGEYQGESNIQVWWLGKAE